MYLIQVLLPVPSASGETRAFSTTREELADKFGGVTAYTRSAQGIWISPEGERERDSMLMIEVFTEEFDRTWWQTYQARLATRFHQEEIHVRALQADIP